MTTGVYKITNLVNGKVYIGASKNIEKRWWEHRSGYTAIAEDLKTFGLDSFKFEVLLECPEDMLCQWERDMICLYDSDDPEKGYNSKYDKPYSLKISETLKGRPSPRRGRPGTPHTEETKRRMSETRKGKSHSEEHNRKISEARKGHIVTIETRRKISEARKGKYSTSHSEETKRKISEARRLYWQKKKESICL